jgi:hypothetical protein
MSAPSLEQKTINDKLVHACDDGLRCSQADFREVRSTPVNGRLRVGRPNVASGSTRGGRAIPTAAVHAPGDEFIGGDVPVTNALADRSIKITFLISRHAFID